MRGKTTCLERVIDLKRLACCIEEHQLLLCWRFVLLPRGLERRCSRDASVFRMPKSELFLPSSPWNVSRSSVLRKALQLILQQASLGAHVGEGSQRLVWQWQSSQWLQGWEMETRRLERCARLRNLKVHLELASHQECLILFWRSLNVAVVQASLPKGWLGPSWCW